MEDSASASAARDRSSASGRSASRLLRYPLRSAASKPKEEKPPLADSTNSTSAAKRGRGPSSVSKSVGVLDLSSKEKPSKPPRRLSVPSKSNNNPVPKSIGNITPISETRAKSSPSNQGKSDTPLSEVSKSSLRKKFSVLSSASYWLSQIRLSESAAKHSISLGFFKLALQAGCEPIQRMSDELKTYVRRHSLPELSGFIKELLESYKINESLEQLQASNASPQVPTEGNQLSDSDDLNSSSSEKPKTVDKNATTGINHAKKSPNGAQKKNNFVKKSKNSVQGNAVTSTKPNLETRGRSTQRKPRKPSKQELGEDNNKEKQAKKIPPPSEGVEENKENMDGAGIEAEKNDTGVEV